MLLQQIEALRMQVSMPSASTSTLRMPSASRSSLSHSTTVRSSIAALPIGTSSSSRSAREDEAADMLGEMARKADQLARRARASGAAVGSVGSRPDLACTCFALRLVARTSPRSCWPSAAVTSSERPNTLPTSRMAPRGAIADHRRGERGAIAAVSVVDVLDHLLAPLMLEIDVDVGRLVALGAR